MTPNNTALGPLLTMFAMLCFAGMDATSKFLVADYAVGQMMWIRYILVFLFAWFIVRRQGLRNVLRTKRPGLQIVRSLVAVVDPRTNGDGRDGQGPPQTCAPFTAAIICGKPKPVPSPEVNGGRQRGWLRIEFGSLRSSPTTVRATM